MRKKDTAYLGQNTYPFPGVGVYIAELVPVPKEVAPPVEVPKPPVAMEIVTDTASIIEKIIDLAGEWPPWR